MSIRRMSIALFAAAVVWLPSVHFFYRPSPSEIASGLEERALAMWSERAELDEAIAAMRRTNAEWDFMSRTYLVLAFANSALSAPERRDEYLSAIDAIIDETLAIESSEGMHFFLMNYSKSSPFVAQPERSVFIDGELAMMLGARRMVTENARYAKLHRERAAIIARRMSENSATYSAESYPDEAWTFCNTIALVSLRMLDALDGTDHSALISAWIANARVKLIDEKTGLLISSYHLDGRHRDGPEGSSIFMVAHCLDALDRDFARDQWLRAKKELVGDALGFGYAREWPSSWSGPIDVDSGPTVPILGANAGASGLAVLGAAAFGDREVLSSLLSSLELAAFPSATAAGRRYRASNAVGDAVLLYALVQGPLWQAIRERTGGPRS